jgi:hypothetical protein
MKVKFIQSAVGTVGTFKKGEVRELDSEVAKDYIAHGICEELQASKPVKRSITTASRKSKKSEKR